MQNIAIDKSSTPTLLVGMADNSNRVHQSRQEAIAASEEDSSYVQSSVDQANGAEEEEKFVNG